MVLQGYTLDGSGAFRSRTRTPCTEWPRTVMRGKPRKLTSGPYSVPKPARRTEPSPRNPRLDARPKGVASEGGFGGCQEGAREPYGALAPFCLRRETPAPPAAGRRHSLSAVGTALPSPPGDPGNPPAVGTAFPSPPGDPGKAAQSYNFVTLQSLSVTQRTDRAPAVPARTYRSRGGTRPP